MVTADEIGEIAIFAWLAPAQSERLSRLAADITLVAGEYAAHEGGERALFAVLEGRIEAVKLVDGIERVVGERNPGDLFGEVPIALGTVFPVGFRAAEPSRVMRLEPHDYHARRGRGTRPRAGGRQARAPTGSAAPRGLQGLAAEPPPPRAIVVGHRWDARLHRAAPLPRPQPDHVQVAHARTRPTPPSSGAARCRPTTTCRRSASSTARPWCGRSSAAWPSCSASTTEPERRGVRHRDRRRRARRARGGRVRRVGGPAHDRDRARGARRPGRHVVADRELPRLPVGRLGRRAREPRAAAGAAARRRDPRHPRRSRGSTPRRRQVHLDGGDVLRARTIILACGVSWRRLDDRRLRPARRQGHLLRRRAQRGAEHARPRRAHRRRRQLGRPGGDVLLHPRAQRDDPLPRRRAREEHVALPDRPARDAAEHRASASRPRSRPPTARRRSRRSTSSTARRARRRGSSRAGCSSSSAPTPRPGGCRPRSRSTRAATC